MTRATPFLKWAGGKRQLLPQLKRFVPPTFSAYHEAFLGSGALFFDLVADGRLAKIPVTLIDNNADLVGAYDALARDPEGVITHLRELARQHVATGDTFYYEVRDQRFNPARMNLRARTNSAPYPVNLAAELLYLNRTGFNGLFRLNASGDFNVPVGRYVNPRICDEENLRRVAAVLSEPNVAIVHDTFKRLLDTARRREFIYFDPPYAPVSKTAHFQSYTAGGFSADDQKQLQKVVIALARRGCWVVLSNSVAPQIQELYDTNVEARRAGLRAHRVPARRAINSDASARGCVEEYLISNVSQF